MMTECDELAESILRAVPIETRLTERQALYLAKRYGLGEASYQVRANVVEAMVEMTADLDPPSGFEESDRKSDAVVYLYDRPSGPYAIFHERKRCKYLYRCSHRLVIGAVRMENWSQVTLK